MSEETPAAADPAGVSDEPVGELSSGMTTTEAMESLNGFEEIAISEHFGASVLTLADKNETVFIRSLIFCELRRQGRSAHDAKNLAMGMRLADAQRFFAEEPSDAMPDEPDSASGKDDSPPENAPTISPRSVSQPA